MFHKKCERTMYEKMQDLLKVPKEELMEMVTMFVDKKTRL